MLCTYALIGLYNCGLLDLWHKWIEEIGEWTWRYKRTSHVISNRTERQNNIAFTTTAAYPKFCSLKISRFLFNKYYIYSSLHPSAIVGYQLAGQTRPQSTSVGKQESQSYCSWTCITHTQDTGTIGTHTKKEKQVDAPQRHVHSETTNSLILNKRCWPPQWKRIEKNK